MPNRLFLSFEQAKGADKDIFARQTNLERQVEELRLSLAKVQQDRDRYEDLYDSAPFGYFICDKTGRILEVNRAGAQLLDRRKGELLAMSFSDCVDWMDFPAFEGSWCALFETGKQQGCELRLIPRNGAAVLAKLECLLIERMAGVHEELARIIVTELKVTKRTQSTLQRSEGRYFSLIDLIPHGVNEVDLTGRIIYTNRAFAVMHGYERNEIIGMHIWDLLEGGEEDKRALRGLIRQLVDQQPPPAPVCLKNQRKDGATIDIQVDWAYKRDERQNLLGFVSIISEITERIEAEKAVRASGKEARRTLKMMGYAIDSSVNAISFIDLNGRITYVNQAFLDMWRIGSSQAQVVGRDALELLGDSAKVRALWKIVMKKDSWRGQVAAKRLDGSKFYAYMGANLLRDEDGTPVGMMGALIDISEQKKAKLALQESERLYRAIFEASSDGICIMEKSSANSCRRVVDCNESYARMAGLTKRELLALPDISEKQIILNSNPAGPRGRDEEIGGCQRIFSWRHSDGKKNYIECRGTPIVVNGKTFNLCVCRDNTRQQREAEENIKNVLSSQLLLVAEEERKRIARDLHDEFGQFLPALRYRLENLQHSLSGASSKHQAEFAKIADLLEKLGIMARTISYDLRPSLLDDFGLVATIEASVREFMNRYERIKVAFSVAGAQKKIFSSLEIVLYRVFQEAMNNVAKHARAQNVTVSLTFSYPSIILMVADDGVGFVPQHRLAMSKRRRESGIGLLGMRERIASVDGKLTVRSEPGKGSLIKAEIFQRWKRAEDRCRQRNDDHSATHPA